MSNRGQSFVVETRRGYASKPGDARRSGRVERAGQVEVHFTDRGSQIEARVGVVTVGAVTHDPTSRGFFWAIYLPGMTSAPRPARDADKARDAITHKVREWCEAARLVGRRGAP
jgi:hypothetical protein